MKRSHIILSIAECLIEPHYPEDPMKEAAYILEKIERFGMLPPTYTGLIANGKKYNKETDFGRDVMSVRGEWEPEDV